jgi:hypothetical protein
MYIRSLKSNIMNENKWNEKTWGKVIQVLFWPLGIYMMFTVPYFSKTTRYVIGAIILFLIIMKGIGGGGAINQRACDCSNTLMYPKSSVYGAEARLKWDNCKNKFGGFSYANELCAKSK